MPQDGRWIIGLVVTVVLVGVFALRHALQSPEREVQPVVPARLPTHLQAPREFAFRPHTSPSDEDADTTEGAPIAARADVQVTSKTPGMKRVAPAAAAAAGRGQGATGQLEAPPAATGDGSGAGAPATGAALSVSFDGSLSGGDQAPPLVAQGIEFDPASGAAHFPPTASLAYPDSGGLNPDQGTVALWVRLEWDPNLPLTKPLVELRTNTWENRFEFGMGPTYIGLLLTNSDGVEQGVGSSIKWAPGEWHHAAVTWGDALMSIYIDGGLANQKPYSGSVIIPPDTPLYVGSSRAGPNKETGAVALRGLNVFQRALSADEIAMIADQNPPPQ